MRVLGTVTLVLGVLFAVLFLIMAFSGDLNWGAFFIPVVLISLGARLRTSARGILQQNPSATPGAPSASSDAAPCSELALPLGLPGAGGACLSSGSAPGAACSGD